jgi:ribosomal protein S18 acetylase RimI-like enzyme
MELREAARFRARPRGVMTDLHLIVEPPTCLSDYARVPSAFQVSERLELARGGIGGDACIPVLPPYVKDYDAQPGQRPADWPRRWDVGNWCFAAALLSDRRAGGAVVVLDAAQVEPSIAAPDAALLWDIRVHPDFRRRGVARALLAFAESRARAAGRRRMIVETQDINVPACRLYVRAGYTLGASNPHAYPNLPDEVQLIWQKALGD